MKEVLQTRTGTDGNCLSACIASILEISIEEIDFTATKGDWLQKTQKALRKLGYYYLGINLMLGVNPVFELPDVYCIFVIPSDLGEVIKHCVVGKLRHIMEENILQVYFEVAYNPLGTRIELTKPPEELGFILPLKYTK